MHTPLPWLGSLVALRRFAPSDLRAFQAYRRDAELGVYQGWSPQADQEAAHFIDEMAHAPLFQPGQWIQLAIELTASSLMIGDLGIFISGDGKQAEIGFTLSRQSHGAGLGTTAVRLAIRCVFESTSVERIVGITDVKNQPSIRLLERVGMQRRETVGGLFKGQPCQERVYAISRQDAG